MPILGLNGFARVGKDEVAKLLIEKHGFVRVSFAEPLRKMLYVLNPIVASFGLSEDAQSRVQNVVDCHGWDEAKVLYPEIRTLLQRLGTECGRNLISQDIWVDLAIRESRKHKKVVFTDVRFVNEAQAIHSRGGVVVRVVRPGVGPVNQHVSDQPLPDELIDITLKNDGTLEDLAEKIEVLRPFLA